MTYFTISITVYLPLLPFFRVGGRFSLATCLILPVKYKHSTGKNDPQGYSLW